MSLNGSGTAVLEERDLAAAERGKRRIEAGFQAMPVFQSIRKQLIRSQVFCDYRLAVLFPLTAEHASFLVSLRDAGAKVALATPVGCPVDGELAAAFGEYGIPIVADQPGGEADAKLVTRLLGNAPNILLDGRGDLARTAVAATEGEDLSGALVDHWHSVRAIQAQACAGELPFPIFDIGGSELLRLFDNRLTAGQRVFDEIVGSLNLLMAGLNVVVMGFGATGQGIASRARGLGAVVFVTEVDPLRALEAATEGYRVLPIAEAAFLGDVFIGATGGRNVIGREHFDKLRNGAVLCSAGSSDAEIDIGILTQIATSSSQAGENVELVCMRDGRRAFLIAGGKSISSPAGEGRPASVSDLSFAIQALTAEYLLKNRPSFENAVHPVPAAIDRQVSKLKLESAGIQIDRLTVEQEQYLVSRSEGA